MSETKHTPGPWESFRYENGEREVGTRQRKIAVMPWTKAPCHVDPEDEANARLIATAPELLQVLIDLQKEIRGVVQFNVRKHYSLMVADAAANRAIAKAEGRL